MPVQIRRRKKQHFSLLMVLKLQLNVLVRNRALMIVRGSL